MFIPMTHYIAKPATTEMTAGLTDYGSYTDVGYTASMGSLTSTALGPFTIIELYTQNTGGGPYLFMRLVGNQVALFNSYTTLSVGAVDYTISEAASVTWNFVNTYIQFNGATHLTDATTYTILLV